MALTIKQLNGDASFLLTFEPIMPDSVSGITAEALRILIDPWIQGPSKNIHAKISVSTHKEAACITSLREMPEPDFVIISQHKSDHCNEATLRQLPANGSRTLILAEPTAARTIRSWKYFHKERVRTIPKWEDTRITGRPGVVRMRVPPVVPDGQPGEVTVAFIPQERDASKLHSAIGITYRPPPVHSLPVRPASRALAVPLSTPPTSPGLRRPHSPATSVPTAPESESPSLGRHSFGSSQGPSCGPVSGKRAAAFDRPLSVIFSPHGMNYSSLHSYATSHLIAEAALPLTALLHCFHSVSNPWWLGGNVRLGAPAGTETAARLGARVWISAHDGDKVVKGLATGLLRTRKFAPDEVLGGLNDSVVNLTHVRSSKLLLPAKTAPGKPESSTEVISLSAGEEVVLSSTGLWRDTCEECREEVLHPVHMANPVPVGYEQGRLCDEDKETNYPRDKHPALRPEMPSQAAGHASYPIGSQLYTPTPPMTPVPEECLLELEDEGVYVSQ